MRSLVTLLIPRPRLGDTTSARASEPDRCRRRATQNAPGSAALASRCPLARASTGGRLPYVSNIPIARSQSGLARTVTPELHDAVGVRRKSKPWKRRRPSLLEKRYCRFFTFPPLRLRLAKYYLCAEIGVQATYAGRRVGFCRFSIDSLCWIFQLSGYASRCRPSCAREQFPSLLFDSF